MSTYKNLVETVYKDRFRDFDYSLSGFNMHHTIFIEKLEEKLFQKVDYDLVVYDEIELFRNYKDPMFNYPY